MIAPVIELIGMWMMAFGILGLVLSFQRQIKTLQNERVRLAREIDQLRMQHSLELLAKGGGV